MGSLLSVTRGALWGPVACFGTTSDPNMCSNPWPLVARINPVTASLPLDGRCILLTLFRKASWQKQCFARGQGWVRGSGLGQRYSRLMSTRLAQLKLNPSTWFSPLTTSITPDFEQDKYIEAVNLQLFAVLVCKHLVQTSSAAAESEQGQHCFLCPFNLQLAGYQCT